MKLIQSFTKTDGTNISVAIKDIAFVIPSGISNGSAVVLGPSAKTITLRLDGTARISYINNSDALVITAVTT